MKNFTSSQVYRTWFKPCIINVDHQSIITYRSSCPSHFSDSQRCLQSSCHFSPPSIPPWTQRSWSPPPRPRLLALCTPLPVNMVVVLKAQNLSFWDGSPAVICPCFIVDRNECFYKKYPTAILLVAADPLQGSLQPIWNWAGSTCTSCKRWNNTKYTPT